MDRRKIISKKWISAGAFKEVPVDIFQPVPVDIGSLDGTGYRYRTLERQPVGLGHLLKRQERNLDFTLETRILLAIEGWISNKKKNGGKEAVYEDLKLKVLKHAIDFARKFAQATENCNPAKLGQARQEYHKHHGALYIKVSKFINVDGMMCKGLKEMTKFLDKNLITIVNNYMNVAEVIEFTNVTGIALSFLQDLSKIIFSPCGMLAALIQTIGFVAPGFVFFIVESICELFIIFAGGEMTKALFSKLYNYLMKKHNQIEVAFTSLLQNAKKLSLKSVSAQTGEKIIKNLQKGAELKEHVDNAGWEQRRLSVS